MDEVSPSNPLNQEKVIFLNQKHLNFPKKLAIFLN